VPSPAKPRFRFARRLGKGLLVFVALAIVAEIGLRVAGHIYLSSVYAQNAVGPDDIPFVCLGESSTLGILLPFGQSYPKQLETKLKQLYHNDHIRVVVPPHVGQNTSQMSNRIDDYLDRYHPRLVIIMAGINNEWSLAESHIARFLPADDPGTRHVRRLALLDRFRLYRVFRWTYLKVVEHEDSDYTRRNSRNIWGHPETARFPGEPEVSETALTHRAAWVALWRSDMHDIIGAAKKRGVKVLLMTYHIAPTYLPVEEFVALAKEEGVPLVRNDLAFQPVIDRGDLIQYVFDDHWHPRANGYAIIANAAFEMIRDLDLMGMK
jgi:lysophospholipase L1-like esterase